MADIIEKNLGRAKRAGCCVTIALCLGLAACDATGIDPLAVSNVQAFAPIPGTTTAVAYFTLTNSSTLARTLNEISSPQFKIVEMHETALNNGVARMRQLTEVQVGAESSLQFISGGKHAMLMNPQGPVEAGTPIELRFLFADGHIVIVTTVLHSRTAG